MDNLLQDECITIQKGVDKLFWDKAQNMLITG